MFFARYCGCLQLKLISVVKTVYPLNLTFYGDRLMIKFTTLHILYFILTILAANPASQNDTASKDIRATWDQFIESWESNNAESCASFYTQNGINIPSGFEINRGLADIESFYRSLFDANQSSTYRHSIHDLQVFGDHAIEYGEFRVDWIPIDGDNWTYHARSLTHWKKVDTGEWKIEKIMYNSPPASDP